MRLFFKTLLVLIVIMVYIAAAGFVLPIFFNGDSFAVIQGMGILVVILAAAVATVWAVIKFVLKKLEV